jgi:uncharacterized membrane protein
MGVSLPHTQYEIVELETLPHGAYCGARAINDDGDVIGWSEASPTGDNPIFLDTAAVIWKQNKISVLYRGDKDHPYPSAQYFNRRGDIVIKAEARSDAHHGLIATMVYSYSMLLSNGKLTPLSLDLEAECLGEDGTVGGQQLFFSAMIFHDGHTTVLGRGIGQEQDCVYGLGSGDVAVGVHRHRATIWRQGWTQTLELPVKCDYSKANAINHRGDVLVSGCEHKSLWRSYLLQNGKYTLLPGPTPGSYMLGTAMNDLGWVIGRSNHMRCLWNGKETIDLNAAISSNSGWWLKELRGINNRGEIVGEGERNGKTRAFLLKPIP